MIYNETSTKYLDWLTRIVWLPNVFRGVSYHRFFNFLFNAPFVPSNEMDQARMNDAIDLRYSFADEIGLPYQVLEHDISTQTTQCSMLEMMIALAKRIEDHIMADNEFGDRTGQWFWEMVMSLGFNNMDDKNFEEGRGWVIIDRFNSRDYLPNGQGSLFTITNPAVDMRQYDIWYQMQIWISENYRNHIV